MDELDVSAKMKGKTLAVIILIALLATVLVLLFLNYPAENGDPAIQARNLSSPSIPQSEKKDGLIVVEEVGLSSDELWELEELFEPIEDKRRVTDVVELGQSVLCDVLTYDDGRVAFTFLTPHSTVGHSGETRLVFKSEMSMLHPDGGIDTLSSPTITAFEAQTAKISLEKADGSAYSVEFSGILIGDDALALSLEMTGNPAMPQEPR